jgi:hypothetical protein
MLIDLDPRTGEHHLRDVDDFTAFAVVAPSANVLPLPPGEPGPRGHLSARVEHVGRRPNDGHTSRRRHRGDPGPAGVAAADPPRLDAPGGAPITVVDSGSTDGTPAAVRLRTLR